MYRLFMRLNFHFFVLQFSGILKELPRNVQLLTLEPLDEKTILLRLEHVFEKDEHKEYSKSATVDLTVYKSAFIKFLLPNI